MQPLTAAGPGGELAEVHGGDPDVGDDAEGAELEAAQARAEAVRDEDQGGVGNALGAAVALERELGYGGEAVEDPGRRGEERGPRVEGEAASAVSQRRHTREQRLRSPEPSRPKTTARSSSGRSAV